MADGERESVLRFLEKCRETHVQWVDFLESGKEYVPSAEHVGDVAHHRECILGYDRALALLGGGDGDHAEKHRRLRRCYGGKRVRGIVRGGTPHRTPRC